MRVVKSEEYRCALESLRADSGCILVQPPAFRRDSDNIDAASPGVWQVRVGPAPAINDRSQAMSAKPQPCVSSPGIPTSPASSARRITTRFARATFRPARRTRRAALRAARRTLGATLRPTRRALRATFRPARRTPRAALRTARRVPLLVLRADLLAFRFALAMRFLLECPASRRDVECHPTNPRMCIRAGISIVALATGKHTSEIVGAGAPSRTITDVSI